jgi:hypothetical protein
VRLSFSLSFRRSCERDRDFQRTLANLALSTDRVASVLLTGLLVYYLAFVLPTQESFYNGLPSLVIDDPSTTAQTPATSTAASSVSSSASTAAAAASSTTASSPPSEQKESDKAPTSQTPITPTNHTSFKSRQDWYFPASPTKVFSPSGPAPSDIIILTAGDGKGNNGEIPDLMGRITQNRQEFCDYHGYTCVFTNITKYDLEGGHPVRSQLPLSLSLSLSEWKKKKKRQRKSSSADAPAKNRSGPKSPPSPKHSRSTRRPNGSGG